LVLAALVGVSGCGLLDNPTPSEATLSLRGEAGAPVRIVASTLFVAARTAPGQPVSAQLIEADTLVRELPFDSTWNIRDGNRFFALVDTLSGEEAPTPFRMIVALDGEERYDQGGALEERVFKFLFIFNEAILSDGEIL
jgi:hypothetical protein